MTEKRYRCCACEKIFINPDDLTCYCGCVLEIDTEYYINRVSELEKENKFSKYRIEVLQNTLHLFSEQNRWIPVSERLPEEYIPVLIHYGESEPESGHLEEGMWFLSGWNNRDRPKGIVTHWIPLPKTPDKN